VCIQTPALLVDAVEKIVEKYGSMENVRPLLDPEVEEEYSRHKEFLQKSILELKKTLESSSMTNMSTNNKMRQSNLTLINEINTQRENNRQLKIEVQAQIGRIRHVAQQQQLNAKKRSSSRGQYSQMGKQEAPPAMDTFTDPAELLGKNSKRIVALRAAIAELELRANSIMQKAFSKETLPPIDGSTALPFNQKQPTSPEILSLPLISARKADEEIGAGVQEALNVLG
jgi:hypothetical protein